MRKANNLLKLETMLNPGEYHIRHKGDLTSRQMLDVLCCVLLINNLSCKKLHWMTTQTIIIILVHSATENE